MQFQTQLCNAFQFIEENIVLHPLNTIEANNLRSQHRKRYGSKVLGSFIGTPEYIKTGLAEYETNFKQIADALIQYPDLQGRMLIFRFCFFPKPYHLFRTIAPEYTIPFAKNMEQIKKLVLASLFDFSNVNPFNKENSDSNSLEYEYMNATINAGGLGFQLYTEVAYSAYVASMISYAKSPVGILHDMKDTLTRFLIIPANLRLSSNTNHKWNYRVSLDVMKLQERFTNLADNSSEHATRNKVHQFLFTKEIDKREEGTLQAFITNILADRRVRNIELSSDATQLTWRSSVKNKESGMFLQAVPKFDKFRLSNLQFCTAIRFRYQSLWLVTEVGCVAHVKSVMIMWLSIPKVIIYSRDALRTDQSALLCTMLSFIPLIIV